MPPHSWKNLFCLIVSTYTHAAAGRPVDILMSALNLFEKIRESVLQCTGHRNRHLQVGKKAHQVPAGYSWVGCLFCLGSLWWWCSPSVESQTSLGASSVGTARLCPWKVLAAEGKWAAEEPSRDVAPISHTVHHQGLLCPSPAQPPANPNCSDKNHTRWKPLSHHRRDQHRAEMQESVILKAGERWANPTHLWKSNCSISFYLHFFHL